MPVPYISHSSLFPMHRFFAGHTDLGAPTIELTDPGEIHHLCHVLRLKAKDHLTLFDGRGREASGEILSVTDTAVSVRLTEQRHLPAPAVPVILACAIPKKAKFESIIEKCTELGVEEIIPLLTRRTEVKLDGERARRKADRYRTVAVNAAKQCKRAFLPAIHPLTALSDALALIRPDDLALIPHLDAAPVELPELLRQQKQLPARIVIFIGPEGDFTPDEVKRATASGARPLSLGPTVLKVDTAAQTAVALAISLLRDRHDA